MGVKGLNLFVFHQLLLFATLSLPCILLFVKLMLYKVAHAAESTCIFAGLCAIIFSLFSI